MVYRGGDGDVNAYGYTKADGNLWRDEDGIICFSPKQAFQNNGCYRLDSSKFTKHNERICGWTIRIKIDKAWFWYSNEETLIPIEEGSARAKLFNVGDRIPYLPVNNVTEVVADPIWGQATYETCRMLYNSGIKANQEELDCATERVDFVRLSTGSCEYPSTAQFVNNGRSHLQQSEFRVSSELQFKGWRLRVRSGETWFWVTGDERNRLIERRAGGFKDAYVFGEEETIPIIPLTSIDVLVAEAVWKCARYRLRYNSGKTSPGCTVSSFRHRGSVAHLGSGSVEFTPQKLARNDGSQPLERPGFSYPGFAFRGWQLRLKMHGSWYWYLEDGSLAPAGTSEPAEGPARRLFPAGGRIPVLGFDYLETVVAQGVWSEEA